MPLNRVFWAECFSWDRMQPISLRSGYEQAHPEIPPSPATSSARVRSVFLSTIVARLREEGTDVLQRLGIKPGPEQALPPEHRFRIDADTARSWEVVAKGIRRMATAVAVVSLLALALRLVLLLAASTWAIWKIAGVTAAIVALVARHAELQLRAQHQLEAQPADTALASEPLVPRVPNESAQSLAGEPSLGFPS
jgi:hypothetical protein